LRDDYPEYFNSKQGSKRQPDHTIAVDPDLPVERIAFTLVFIISGKLGSEPFEFQLILLQFLKEIIRSLFLYGRFNDLFLRITGG
jgi:hypothetical protein